MSKFLNEKYINLDAYVPGEQPQDKKYIKLNTNESPYLPSQAVIEAVKEEKTMMLQLYPDPECRNLRMLLAKQYDTEFENIFVSNGSDDILNFAFMAFAGAGKKAVFSDITYGFYKVFADLHGIESVIKPLKDDFQIEAEDYYNAEGFVAIANPNAPTGIALPVSKIEEIVQNNPKNVVLIDEAYVDFGAESAVSLTKKYENLLVVGTYSKSRNMAGARLGYAIGNAELIKDLEKIKYSTNPYSVNRMTLSAGEAALLSQEYYNEKCKETINIREYTKKALEEMDFSVLPSSANFLFAKKEGKEGEYIYKSLKEKGILVRHFNEPRIKDYNRITIGDKEQMDTLISALKAILE